MLGVPRTNDSMHISTVVALHPLHARPDWGFIRLSIIDRLNPQRLSLQF